MLLPYLIYVLFNPLTENGDLGHHQDFVEKKARLDAVWRRSKLTSKSASMFASSSCQP